jgi:hypothetical protein
MVFVPFRIDTGSLKAGRYLTSAEKCAELEGWVTEGADARFADEGVRPLMDRLNALEGVCSVQSCIGHVRERRSDGTRYVENGHVELRLDAERTRLFYAAMPTLRAINGVDDVTISWRTPYQVCNVWFQPGRMPAVVDALFSALAPPSTVRDEGAPTKGAESWL